MKKIFRIFVKAIKSEGFIFVIFLLALLFQLLDNGIYPIMALSIGLFFWAFKKNKLVDGTAMLLLLSAILLFIFTPSYKSGAFVITIIFGSFSFYIYGKYLVQRTRENKEILCAVILLIIISFSFIFWRSVISSLVTGSHEYSNRILLVEGISHDLSATLFALVASLGLSGLAIFVGAKKRMDNIFIWLFFLTFILSFIGTTTLVNRSGLVVPLIPLAVIILYNSRGHFFRTLSIIVIITIVGIILYNNYIADSDVMRAYELRSETIEGAGGDRFWRWGDAIKRLLSNPLEMSNESDRGYNYVHNMWLDIARMGGVLPFITFLIATLQIIEVQLELFKIKNDDIVVILISLFVAILSASMIEPVLEACPPFFVLSISFWGMSKEYLVENRRRLSNAAGSKCNNH